MKSIISRTVGVLAVFVTISFSLPAIARAQAFSFSPDSRFILPASSGKELLTQCSRQVPTAVVEYWQPSASEIAEVESSLETYLVSREKEGKAIPPKGSGYRRQYVGFVARVGANHKTERFIYGNFYPYTLPEAELKSESSRPVMVCDGGPAFWGIVYRLSTKTFEQIAFNGRA